MVKVQDGLNQRSNMELELIYIMFTILLGAFVSAGFVAYYYVHGAVTCSPRVLGLMALVGGASMVFGSLLIIFTWRTVVFMIGFIMVLIGILLIIGAVWSALYSMKMMVDVIKRSVEE